MGSGEGDSDVGSTRMLSSGENRRVVVDGRRNVEPPRDPRQGGSVMTRTQVWEVRSQEFGATRCGVVGRGCGGPQCSHVEGSEERESSRVRVAVGGEHARRDAKSTGDEVDAVGVAGEDVRDGVVTCGDDARWPQGTRPLQGCGHRWGRAGSGVGVPASARTMSCSPHGRAWGGGSWPAMAAARRQGAGPTGGGAARLAQGRHGGGQCR
jgi:hypothetical protein